MLSKEFLIEQKQCCGKGCFMCPYLPRHKQGSKKIMNRMGYACINMKLSSQKPKIYTGRSMIKRTFKAKGIEYASQLGLDNCKDLCKILEWNNNNGFKFFRIPSNLFPPHPHVVDNCITDLSIHGEVFDLMGLSRTPYNKINIHIGGVYGDKVSAMERFCTNFHRLPNSVKSRLTVENDDKASMYSVVDLYEGVYKVIGIPIVFDYHHHRFNTGGLSEEDALEVAISTWVDIVPVVHYSESRNIEQEDPKIRPQAHSDYVLDYIDTYGNRVDIMVEAKAKELAVLKYKEIHNDTRTNS